MASTSPLLSKLNNYGQGGLRRGIRGAEVRALISEAYSELLDLLPRQDTPAICEPMTISSEKGGAPLTHKRLHEFLSKSFDLQAFNLPYGSRVAVLLPNGPELAVCLIGVMSHWCAAPINPTYTHTEIESELRSTRARAIIILAGSSINDGAIAAAKATNVGVIVITPQGSTTGLFHMAVLLPIGNASSTSSPTPITSAISKNATALLLHTSGTSGNKKLVPYSLEMIIIGVGCIISSWNLSAQDVCLNMMPLFHIGGIMRNILSPILAGGSVITCSGFDPILFWDVLSTQRVTWYYAAPTMHHAILLQCEERARPLPVSTVRFIANAAGGLLPVLAEKLKTTFDAVILTSYGMTECMPISSPPQDYKLDPTGTSGIPVGPDVCIADDEMNECPIGTRGNILVRGPPCFRGYENDPAANAEAFVTVPNRGEGWFNTGDVGSLDKEGYLFISGRSKEIINRGGETISPFEIEEAVVQHPRIKETIAFSAPHEQFQETVGAVIVTKPGEKFVDLPTLHKFLESRLHRSKWPQVLVLMDALPKNAAGKVLRIKFADRTKLDDVDEESSPLTRMFQGKCPPVGAPLTQLIPLTPLKVDPRETEAFLSKQTNVRAASVVKVNLPFRLDSFVAFVVLDSSSSSSLHSLMGDKHAEIETALQKACEAQLHSFLAPVFVRVVTDFPKLTSGEGKGDIDKQILETRALHIFNERNCVAPRNNTERQIEMVWREQLGSNSAISVTVSFFDIGGDSLKAGKLISALRKKLQVQLSVADLFTAPTIESLSHKIALMKTLGSPAMSSGGGNNNKNRSGLLNSASSASQLSPQFNKDSPNPYVRWEHAMMYSNTSLPCLITQLLPILVIFPFRSIIIWFLIAAPWVELMKRGFGRLDALLLAMVISRVLLGLGAPLLGIAAKWIIVGKYKPGRYALWSTYYLKWWLVEQIINIMGKGWFRDDLPIVGSTLVRLYYILMGAKIGNNVKIHKDAVLAQADLLTMGDDVTIDKATLRPFSLEEGHFVLLPIVVGPRCSIGVKSTIAAGSTLLSGTCIGPLSSSHEKDDAEPSYRNYCRPGFLQPPAYMILLFGCPLLILVTSIGLIPWYIGLKLMVASAKENGWYESDIHSIFHAFLWWITPQRLLFYFFIRIIRRCFVPPVRLVMVIAIKKLIIGPFVPMDAEEKQKPWNLFRYWLMSRLLPGGGLGGVAKLVGTHYEIISIIYRALGAKIGKNVYWPGSGLDIVEYDLLEVGNDVVFGSRSVVFTSTKVRSAKVVFEDGSMIADRCVVLPGVKVGRAAVLGSGSLAPEDMDVPVGSVWVGSTQGSPVNVAPADFSYATKDTTTPFGRAFYEGKATYKVVPLWAIVLYNTSWQAFCTCFRHGALPISLILCRRIMQFDDIEYSPLEVFKISMLAFAPVKLAFCLTSLAVDICGKWFLLGRRKQGAYPWDESSYCQNWQMYLTLQEIRRAERRKNGVLDMIQGSQYLVWYFRALGASIGNNVCLYPNGADPMMTEPDLVDIGDQACIDDASLIAHINTRGVFRLNPLVVGKFAVLKSMTRLLSGATADQNSMMLEHTLVMAGETVDMGSVWQGWPSSSSTSLFAHRQKVAKLLDQVAIQIIAESVGSKDNNDGSATTGDEEKGGDRGAFQRDSRLVTSSSSSAAAAATSSNSNSKSNSKSKNKPSELEKLPLLSSASSSLNSSYSYDGSKKTSSGGSKNSSFEI